MRRKVLIVEDDEAVVDLVKTYLEIRGALQNIEIIWGQNTSEGRVLFQEHESEIEVVALDYNLPGKSGNSERLITEMVQSTFFSGVVIAMSGESHNREKLLRLGASYEAEKERIAKLICKILA